MAENKRYGVGYALLPKKQKSFIQDSLLTSTESRGIDMIKIDTSRPLTDQGPFDCILHKLYGDDWRRQLKEFKELNPNAIVLDSPKAIERLHNRISMLHFVSELRIDTDNDTFGIPKQIVIYDKETLFDRKSCEYLKYPVIAKPLVADGSAKSHKMALVFNHDGLNMLNPPIVLQEFVNHGGVIFKVYVVGKYVKCVKRKSLPDGPEEKLIEQAKDGSLSFSQISNLNTPERRDDNKTVLMQMDDTELPPQKLMTDIAWGLREAMKINLFNFDVIRDTEKGNRYLVIDINYFPGYSKMPSYESVMTDFFCDLMNEEKGSGTSLTEEIANEPKPKRGEEATEIANELKTKRGEEPDSSEKEEEGVSHV